MDDKLFSCKSSFCYFLATQINIGVLRKNHDKLSKRGTSLKGGDWISSGLLEEDENQDCLSHLRAHWWYLQYSLLIIFLVHYEDDKLKYTVNKMNFLHGLSSNLVAWDTLWQWACLLWRESGQDGPSHHCWRIAQQFDQTFVKSRIGLISESQGKAQLIAWSFILEAEPKVNILTIRVL